MKPLVNTTKNITTVFALILAIFSFSYANTSYKSLNTNYLNVTKSSVKESYSFKVHNNTGTTIKQILVSEDGSSFGYFDIGNGIAPGSTVELVWDQSTNGESCHQYFKAVFSDGSESQAVKFDFCESGLVLEFS